MGMRHFNQEESKKGEWDLARDLFLQTVEIDVNHYQAWQRLGDIQSAEDWTTSCNLGQHHDTKMSMKTLHYYKRSVQVAWTNADAWVGLGFSLLHRKSNMLSDIIDI